MRDGIRQLLLLRRVYRNWPSIWFYWFTKRKRNIAQANLKSGRKVRANGGLMFSNLTGLAYLIQGGWKIIDSGENFLTLEDPRIGIKMKCRTNVGFDLSFLAFIFVQKVYRTNFNGKSVIDAGSYTGDTAIYFVTNGASRVIGLEPYQENLDLALENVNQLNNLGGKITLVKAALSTNDGTTDFKVFENEPNGNRIATYSDRQTYTIKAKTMTIETLMREFDLPRVNVLKLNCEGAEYDIIDSLSEMTAQLVDEIYVEFHRGPERIITSLEKLGYSVSGQKRKNVKFGHLRAFRKVVPSITNSDQIA
jgi:FkbM family methyltransferase